jgi:hypothetical protein
MNSSFHILGALMGSTSFVELFVVEVLYEDLGTISNLRMPFVMLSLCYA